MKKISLHVNCPLDMHCVYQIYNHIVTVIKDDFRLGREGEPVVRLWKGTGRVVKKHTQSRAPQRADGTVALLSYRTAPAQASRVGCLTRCNHR